MPPFILLPRRAAAPRCSATPDTRRASAAPAMRYVLTRFMSSMRRRRAITCYDDDMPLC